LREGDRSGLELGVRLVEEAGVAGIAFHPRSASSQHKGKPDYALVRELTGRVGVPVIVSGGLATAEAAREAYLASGADAVMIARGALGNPWIFEQLTGARHSEPDRDEIVAELLWVLDRAEEHLGPGRAARYLRKFYPWYLERLGAPDELAAGLQETDELAAARELIAALAPLPAAA
jgi:tRNA-dihydrouridine synthase